MAHKNGDAAQNQGDETAKQRATGTEGAPIFIGGDDAEKTNGTAPDATASQPEAPATPLPPAGTGIAETAETPGAAIQPPKKHGLKRLGHWCKTHKKASIPLAIALFIAALAAIPFTRYALAGLVWQQEYRVRVLDAQTNTPVSGAMIMLAGKTAATNGEGDATVKAPAGRKQLEVSKNYYHSANQTVLVPILRPRSALTVHLVATGRQVPLSLVNVITKQPVANAVIQASDATATTDKNGKATLVVPAGKQTVSVRISANGYNTATASVQVTTQAVSANDFKLTPRGKVYFLSNLSGNIDVMKSNLDGSDRQTVLAGTGKEDKQNTVLLASRDWKYLALLSRRDGGNNAKLFLIDTSSDGVSTIDEGQATFTLVGWSNDTFVYRVDRQNVQAWQPKAAALKSFDAAAKKLNLLDETAAGGDDALNCASEAYGSVYSIGTDVVFIKNWSACVNGRSRLVGKQATINAVKDNGSGKRVIKGFSTADNAQQYGLSLQSYLYEPGGIYVKFDEDIASGDKAPTYVYEDGQVKAGTPSSWNDFNSAQGAYPTYLLSPSGNQTFWSELRDGKTALFVGDADAKRQRQIAALSGYQTYGWFTDSYLLMSKNGSELYIMPSNGSQNPLKLTDYYKPATLFRGYGGGYGGL